MVGVVFTYINNSTIYLWFRWGMHAPMNPSFGVYIALTGACTSVSITAYLLHNESARYLSHNESASGLDGMGTIRCRNEGSAVSDSEPPTLYSLSE